MKRIFILCIIAVFVHENTQAQRKKGAVAESDEKQLYAVKFDNYMNGQVKINDFSGNVLVAQKGKIVYQRSFGLADKELNVKTNLASRFQIGSLTKQFTACAILQLVELGKLKLTDTIGTYFPGFPNGGSVTIHMLLNHASGIPDYTRIPAFWDIMATPVEKDSVVALVKRQAFDFAPGSNWNYSNSGYFLLGYIIEKVSGQSYSDYVLNKIIKKAGLENTFVNRWDSIIANRVKGYMKDENNSWQNAMYISMEGAYSAGAIISTAGDLYKWNTALFGNKIISAASLTKMTTPYMKHYGYGLGIDSFYKHPSIDHSGSIPGFTAYLVQFPADSATVLVLSNNIGNCPAIAKALAANLFGIPVILPYKHSAVKIDPTIAGRYPGKYASSDTLEIIIKDGKLFRHRQQFDTELKPESNTKFFYADDSDRQIEFKVDKSGSVISLFFINGGLKEEMKRL